MSPESLISSGVNLLGSGLGYFSNRSANKRMADMYRSSLDFQRYTYQDSKRFNSIPGQVSQMRAAGLNPALALSNGVGSSASAAGSPSPATQNGFDFGSGFNAASSAFLEGSSIDIQRKLSNSEVQKNEADTALTNEEQNKLFIQNMYEHRRQRAEIQGLNLGIKEKRSMIEGLDLANNLSRQTLANRVEQEEWRSELLRAQAGAQLIMNAYLPQFNDKQLELQAANIALAYANKTATLEQAMSAMMQARAAKVASDAQYGDTKEKRDNFAKAAYHYLLQQRNESESREYSNLYTPGSYNIGGKVIGISSSYVQGRHSHFEDWRYKTRQKNYE